MFSFDFDFEVLRKRRHLRSQFNRKAKLMRRGERELTCMSEVVVVESDSMTSPLVEPLRRLAGRSGDRERVLLLSARATLSGYSCVHR